MKKNKDQHIDKLLKKISTDKAPKNFTSKIMSDIDILTNEELLKDSKLSTLLKENAINKPSSGFVSNIMSSVETNREKIYKPIISKQSWFVIGIITAIVVVYAFYNNTPTTTSILVDKTAPYLERFLTLFSSFKINLNLSMIFIL